MYYDRWPSYVSVAAQRAKAAREMNKLRKKGVDIQPVEVQSRKIAQTFWGEAWCSHLERFSDYENRLPRGRTYVRNGSVCHLAIKPGGIEAIVSGTELYHVTIQITRLSLVRWKNIRKQCAGQIGTMLELLQGQFSNHVMGIVTDPAKGLFPQPRDIKLHCDCPDSATMCKHVAAVLYGVGARLDSQPELLFVLRKVDHQELISADLDMQAATSGQGKRRRLTNQDLTTVFGIDIDEPSPPAREAPPKKTARCASKDKAAQEKTASARGKTRAGKAKVAAKKRAFTPAGAAIARLRKQYRMTPSEFADLIGVSVQTVANWETRGDKLKLQQRTLAALTRAWLRK